ncbi:MAG: PRC-barrel domain-containing protein [Rhizobium sp.]
MKKSLNTMVAVLLLGSSALAPAAFAQTATTPAPATPSMQSTTPNATAPTAVAPANTTDTAEVPATYITEQSPTQISANDYIGQKVLNNANESIGDINDLILEKNGGIVAAIVGVGGFLGIGEKSVAVPIENITVTEATETGDLKLTTMETAESLKAAPEFKTLSDQRSAATTTTTGADATTTSSTTTPAPATPAPSK